MSVAARIGGNLLPTGSSSIVARAATPSSSERRGEAAPSGLSISLDHVTRAFGERVVLDDLSLQIPAGQAVAVVGRSGGGKSTLLRLLMGLDRPTSGVIEIEGAQVRGLQPAVRLMFQEPRLLPWQTVLGNVGLGRGAGWRARARAALESVGLADRADEWPSVLSGGQRQRVALARALVDRPGVLLLDEPFSALDALTRAEMHQLLTGLWTARGFTAVLITHDVGEAIALADRVLVLREGRLSLDLPIPIDRSARDLHGAAAAELRTRIMAAV